MQLDKLSITVDIGGVTLQEYDLKQEGNKETTCSVASEEGKVRSMSGHSILIAIKHYIPAFRFEIGES